MSTDWFRQQNSETENFDLKTQFLERDRQQQLLQSHHQQRAGGGGAGGGGATRSMTNLKYSKTEDVTSNLPARKSVDAMSGQQPAGKYGTK